MTKPSLRTKTFNELVELASIGGAFMALAEKYGAAMEVPIKRRKRRRKKVVAEAGNSEDKTAVKAKTKGKAPAVPKSEGKAKVPPIVKQGKAVAVEEE